jgi:excisionase family DNA binding protein
VTEPIDEDRSLTTREVATLLKVSVRFVVEEIRDGRLRAHYLEGRKRTIYRVTPEDYQAYFRERWRPVVRNDRREAS